MRAVVVYESMFGNTRRIAEAVALGIAATDEVTLVPATHVQAEMLDAVDLVVVGGPTHAHGMASPHTRVAAVDQARNSGGSLVIEPTAKGPGVREWLADMPHSGVGAAAFDTRVDIAPALSGRASRAIARRLRRHGYHLVAEPESFLVTRGNELVEGEVARARAWGAHLARTTASGRVALAG